MTDETVDVLAIGAHPDDVELCVGGTLLAARSRGLRIGICHMTAGELGSRGSAEIRRGEARDAATALGAHAMEILDLPDGGIQANAATRERLVDLFRRRRPKTIFAPPMRDLHPDHAALGRAVREAWFLSGVRRFGAGGEPWRPPGLFHYMQHTPFDPTLVVDVSDFFEDKKKAALCYASQFHDPQSDEPETFISRPDFWSWWEARHGWWGHFIGVRYGEPLLVDGPIPTRAPFDIFDGFGKYQNP